MTLRGSAGKTARWVEVGTIFGPDMTVARKSVQRVEDGWRKTARVSHLHTHEVTMATQQQEPKGFKYVIGKLRSLSPS